MLIFQYFISIFFLLKEMVYDFQRICTNLDLISSPVVPSLALDAILLSLLI